MYEELELYIGVKIVGLKPMNRVEYNDHRGWDLPSDEDGTDEGYLVEYKDGGESNHPEHLGYISWAPKEQANKVYRKAEGMTFGMAVEALKKGYKVARKGWNGKGMWIVLVGRNTMVQPFVDPYILMFTVQGTMQPGWQATQSDMLADDWELVI